MENKLEQSLMYAPKSTLTDKVYSIVDLSGLSAVTLYSEEYDKYIEETYRDDVDGKNGEHINYEVWMKKIGRKKGRNKGLSNEHIIISNPTSSLGS